MWGSVLPQLHADSAWPAAALACCSALLQGCPWLLCCREMGVEAAQSFHMQVGLHLYTPTLIASSALVLNMGLPLASIAWPLCAGLGRLHPRGAQ